MPRFVPVASIRRIEFDGEVVLFNPLSWETHLLNETAAAVFDLLHDVPCGTEDVSEFLAGILEEAERHRGEEHASAVLRDLAALGLIREEGSGDGAPC
jgi:PqqD family protein of HPr-rel-A system